MVAVAAAKTCCPPLETLVDSVGTALGEASLVWGCTALGTARSWQGVGNREDPSCEAQVGSLDPCAQEATYHESSGSQGEVLVVLLGGRSSLLLEEGEGP